MLAGVSPPATAAPSAVWVLAVGGTPLTGEETIELEGELSFIMTVKGIPGMQFDCYFEPGFLEIEVPNPAPEAPPGGSISLPITIPDLISEFGSGTDERCMSNYTADVINVISSGADWTVALEMPSGTVQSSPLDATLYLPLHALGIEPAVSWPTCLVHLPTGHTLAAEYGNGAIDSSPANQVVPVSAATPCQMFSDAATNFSLDVDPALELVYVP